MGYLGILLLGLLSVVCHVSCTTCVIDTMEIVDDDATETDVILSMRLPEGAVKAIKSGIYFKCKPGGIFFACIQNIPCTVLDNCNTLYLQRNDDGTKSLSCNSRRKKRHTVERIDLDKEEFFDS